MPYDVFIGSIRQSIKQCYQALKPNRFMVFVVGEYRNKSGAYVGFVPDTIRACLDAGFALYNDAVLITPGGTLSIRAGGAFRASRKLGKGHQNVLVFLKGDQKMARAAMTPVEPYPFVKIG